MAAFFVASAVVTQGWRALVTCYYGDAVALEPSGAVLVVALALSLLLVAARLATARRCGRRFRWPSWVSRWSRSWDRALQSPTEYARRAVQSPPTSVFLFRAFEMDRIVAPDNGPASRELARAVERELLTKEPYRSYGVDLDEFFSSGSDRVFSDMTKPHGSICLL